MIVERVSEVSKSGYTRHFFIGSKQRPAPDSGWG